MSNPDASLPFYIPGNTGFEDQGQAAIGYNAFNGALQQLYRVRGEIDLSLNRLPTINDITVSPAEAIIPYDAFIVSVAGSVPVSVTGAATLAVGDYMIFFGTDPTAATGWFAFAAPKPVTPGTALPAQPGFNPNATPEMNGISLQPYQAASTVGAAPNWVVILDKHLPFFP